jgi:hypothetical protein
MKKLVVIGLGIVILLSLLLLWRHHVRSSSGVDVSQMSDAEVTKMFTGNWVNKGSWEQLILHSKRSFTDRLRPDSTTSTECLYEGVWDVKDGFLSLTITNAITRIDTNIKSIGSIDRFRIVQVDTNALVLEKSSSTNYFER